MTLQEENQYFRRLLNLHPTTPLDEQRSLMLCNADKVMRGLPHPAANQHLRVIEPKPPDRWEYITCLGGDKIDFDDIGAMGFEAYAAAFNADGKQVIWMKRRLP